MGTKWFRVHPSTLRGIPVWMGAFYYTTQWNSWLFKSKNTLPVNPAVFQMEFLVLFSSRFNGQIAASSEGGCLPVMKKSWIFRYYFLIYVQSWSKKMWDILCILLNIVIFFPPWGRRGGIWINFNLYLFFF